MKNQKITPLWTSVQQAVNILLISSQILIKIKPTPLLFSSKAA